MAANRRRGHEIHHDLVRDPNHGATPYVVVLQLRDRVFGKCRQRSLDGRDVLVRGVHEQVDVLGRADEAVENDGESADQEVADAFRAERAAEGEEVFELRCAAERAI